MTTLRTAAQQALEALEKVKHGQWEEDSREGRALITALRTALEQPERAQAMRDAGYTRRPTLREMADQEQPEQAPVAWMVYTQDGKSVCVTHNPADFIEWRSFPLFTHPPRREWRGLTDTERAAVQFESFKRGLSPLEFMELHEAALRSKNHE